jgi:hypothetical protein
MKYYLRTLHGDGIGIGMIKWQLRVHAEVLTPRFTRARL